MSGGRVGPRAGLFRGPSLLKSWQGRNAGCYIAFRALPLETGGFPLLASLCRNADESAPRYKLSTHRWEWAAVRDYRVYYLNENGRVVRRETIRCESDERALALLDKRREEPIVELWDLGRLVKRLDGERL